MTISPRALTSAAACSLLAAGAGAAVGAAGAGAADTRSPATVHLRDISVSPKRVTITPGRSVTWRFEDASSDTPHNVTSSGRPRFRSSVTKQSGTYRVTFTRRGTYRYMCTLHPGMTGTVVVR